jgi:hypothetical protein
MVKTNVYTHRTSKGYGDLTVAFFVSEQENLPDLI